MSNMEKKENYAYVWCLFGGDSYIAGAIPSAYSVKSTTKYDLVCMVTSDVSTQARIILKRVFTHIVDIEYAKFKTRALKTKNQQNIYSGWSDKGYTKMVCLSLIKYDKILLMDADTITLKNIDHLFNLEAPAGTFSSPWSKKYQGSKGGFELPYPQTHGDKITPKMVEQGLNGSVVVIGTTLLLQPSLEYYSEYLDMLGELSQGQGIHFDCYSMTDESTISYYFSVKKKMDWTYIHQRYNFFIGKDFWLEKGEYPSVLHYYKDKTWTLKLQRFKWLDTEPYFEIVDYLIAKKILTRDEVKKYIESYLAPRQTLCDWCKKAKKNAAHTIFDSSVSLKCPLLLQAK